MAGQTTSARRPAPVAVDPWSAARTIGHGAALAAAAVAFALAGVAAAVSGLVVPSWTRWVFVALWFVGLRLLVAWRRRPLHALSVPLAMWAFMILTVVIGDLWFGWTA